MTVFEIKLRRPGRQSRTRVIEIDALTAGYACERAADLYPGDEVVAWRQKSAHGTIVNVHHTQIIG